MTDLTTRTWTLYQLRNTTTGHLYIGQTVQTLNDRWKRHCSLARAGHTSVLAASIREYGPSAFTGVELVQVNTQAEADEWETLLIAAHPRSRLYNEQAGGNSGVPLTAEAERKRRDKHATAMKDPVRAARMSAAIKAWWATQPAEVRSQRAKQRRAGRKAQCASE